MMFFKDSIYVPFGKSELPTYKPNLYDDEVNSPFEEVNVPMEYIEFFEKENSYLHEVTSKVDDDIAKDDILEYILKEYS
ncbi:MAG: hypothetical protein LIO71_00285 [Ruminococcus sp.]|nr:hypothetical protein [Ruminococcus sp.]MCD7799933.1 hypothetical protein [Ruminococcus sp.]